MTKGIGRMSQKRLLIDTSPQIFYIYFSYDSFTYRESVVAVSPCVC